MPSPSQQSHLRHPLTAAFGGAQVRVLRELALNDAPSSVAQIATAAGLTPQGTRRILGLLGAQRLVEVHGAGRSQLFAFDRRNPMSAPLRELFEAERRAHDRFADDLRRALRDVPEIRSAWLYGSVARGEDEADSDVDLFILASSLSELRSSRRWSQALREIESRHGVVLSLGLTSPEHIAQLTDDDPFWVNLLRDARVLKGDAPSVERRRALALAKAATVATE